MLAYVTNGNLPVIARILRHKQWKSTQKYVHNIAFKEEDYEETVATTPEEIRTLGKSGWTKCDEMTVAGVQMHFYRKPKRFESLKNIDNKSQTMDISNISKVVAMSPANPCFSFLSIYSQKLCSGDKSLFEARPTWRHHPHFSLFLLECIDYSLLFSSAPLIYFLYYFRL